MAAENVYVFDACAVIALLHNEPGATAVEGILNEDDSRCVLHIVNVCEIYYDMYRRVGEAGAARLEKILARFGFEIDASVSSDFWRSAGKLKAEWRRVSLADCFALALTLQEKGTLVTSDRHELGDIAEAKVCPIHFIR